MRSHFCFVRGQEGRPVYWHQTDGTYTRTLKSQKTHCLRSHFCVISRLGRQCGRTCFMQIPSWLRMGAAQWEAGFNAVVLALHSDRSSALFVRCPPSLWRTRTNARLRPLPRHSVRLRRGRCSTPHHSHPPYAAAVGGLMTRGSQRFLPGRGTKLHCGLVFASSRGAVQFNFDIELLIDRDRS